jgi:hypothetical protein
MAINSQEFLKNKILSGEIETFFDCLADILLKYSNGKLIESDKFKKVFSPYMLCRYLSMRESLVEYAEYFNLLQGTLTSEQIYLLAYNSTPKQNTGYIKYLKKTNKSNQEKNQENINSNNDELNINLFEL